MQGSEFYRTPESTRPHWNYFLALEKDLEAVSRYIEFSPDNLNTYSIELAHLLLSAASEVDTLAKCICSILDPKAKPENINEYRRIIKAAEDNEPTDSHIARIAKEKNKPIPEVFFHRLSGIRVYVPRYRLEFVPWESWANDDVDPNYGYCRYEVIRMRQAPHAGEYQRKVVTRYMDSESAFLRFGTEFYDNPIAELGGYISSVSKDVGRLERHLDDSRYDRE